MRQAKLGASCQVEVLAEEGLTNHSYRVWQLWRKHEVKPNDTGEAYTGHHGARRGVRTPQSLTQPRKPLDAEGDGGNAPEAHTAAAFFFGELPEDLPGSTVERGRRGEKRQARGRPGRCQPAGTPGHGIRILSHAGGNPATHGRPDPKPRRKRQRVGQRNYKESGR